MALVASVLQLPIGPAAAQDGPPAPPELEVFSSTVAGDTVTLVFDGPLDETTVPAWPQFTVNATPPLSDSARQIHVAQDGVAVSGSTVTLTLRWPVDKGDAVKVAYSQSKTSTGTGGSPVTLLLGANGAKVGEFSGIGLTNTTPEPPNVMSATVSGDRLEIVFDADLDTGRVPRGAQFKATVAPVGAADAVSVGVSGAVSVEGRTVTLTLSRPVDKGYAVHLTYDRYPQTVPLSSATLSGANGSPVAGFQRLPVTNITPDPVRLVSATVLDDVVTLLHDGELDTDKDHAPTWPQFTVLVTSGGTTNTVLVADEDGVRVTSREVTLVLRQPVGKGDIVTVSYSHTDASTGSTPVRLRGANGAAVGEYTQREVINGTPDPPGLRTAFVYGDRLVLTFSGSLDGARVPHKTQFAVKVTGTAAGATATARDVAAVAVSGQRVTLTLASAVLKDETVTLTYSQTAPDPAVGEPPVEAETLRGARGGLVMFGDTTTVINRTGLVPGTESATVIGDRLEIVFDAPLDEAAAHRPDAAQFTVQYTLDGSRETVTVSAVNVSGATVVLTLAQPVVASYSDSVLVAYLKPSASPLRGRESPNPLVETFSVSVDNATPPVFVSASVNASTVELVFDAALVSAGPYVPYWSQFTVTVTPPGGQPSAVPVVPWDLAQSENGVVVDGLKVTLTLETLEGQARIREDDGVTVAYSHTADTGETPRLLRAGVAPHPAVGPFDDRAVTNNTPPAPESGTVRFKTVTLAFDNPLDDGSEYQPLPSQFRASTQDLIGQLDSIRVADGGVAVSGSTVTLTLAQAVAGGDSVKIDYSDEPDADEMVKPLRGTSGRNVNPFESFSVQNTTPSPPKVSSARVNGTSLVLVFDAELDRNMNMVPDKSQFRVKRTPVGVGAAAETVNVTAVVVSGSKVTLTLAPPVLKDETVTLSYSKTAVGATAVLLRSSAEGNLEVDAFTDKEVVNTTGLAPSVSSASVDGAELMLVFNSGLDGGRVPHHSQFTVKVTPEGATESAERPLTSGGVAVAGSTVTLTLRSPVAISDTVTVSYSQTEADSGVTLARLRSMEEPSHDVEDFADRAVTNNTPPRVRSVSVNAGEVVIVFDASLDESAAYRPLASQFGVRIGRDSLSVSAVAVSGVEVTLTLASPVAAGQVVGVAYGHSAGAGETARRLRAAAGPNREVAEFSGRTATNRTPPVLESATVSGATLVLTFDVGVEAGLFSGAPHPSQFTVKADGTAVAVSAVAVSGVEVTLTLESAVAAGVTVTVSYSKEAAQTGAVAVALTADAAPRPKVDAFTDQAVVNTTGRAPSAPSASSASVDGAELMLVFNSGLDGGRVPHHSQFTVKVTPEGATESAERPLTSGGVAVAGSTVTLTLRSPVAISDTVTVSYSQTEADSGVTLVRLRGINEADVEDFADRAVTNNTPPRVRSVSVNAGEVVIVFDASLDESAAYRPLASQFGVRIGRDSLSVSAVAVSGVEVTLTLASPVAAGQVVGVAYGHSAGAGETARRLRAAAGPNREVAEFSGRTATNRTPPVLESATVSGATLVLTFDVGVEAGLFSGAPHPSQFTVKADGTAVAVSAVAVSGVEVTLTLESAVAAGVTVTVSYSKEAAQTGAVAVALTADAAPRPKVDAFTDQAVVNRPPDSPGPPIPPPDAVTPPPDAVTPPPSRGGGGSVAPPPAAPPAGVAPVRVMFDDIGLGHVHFASVGALAEAGVFSGTLCEPLRFCADDELPRWMMAVWLVRVIDGRDPAPVRSSRFEDVDPGVWWARHVERLAELGVIQGCSRAPARFCADGSVTRAQMAGFLNRAFELAVAAPAGFADTSGSVHRADIDALFAAGIIRGCATGPLRYCPHDSVSRAQMATFLDRARVRAGKERPDRGRVAPFDDIGLGHVHFASVGALAEAGVFSGTLCEPLRFCADDELPRWMMAVWLVRVIDGRDPAPVRSSRFEDVDPGVWWARHVERLAELGVTKGCSRAPARFCADGSVTRAQMAGFLNRAFELAVAAPAGFADTSGSVHRADIDALFAAGIIRGCATGPLRYCPHDSVSRAQMATFLDRARVRAK